MDDVRKADEGTVVLFHMCAHNPTGIDPTDEQWGELLEAVKDRKLIPFFDAAYQGFVTGNPDTDAYSARLFADAGCEMLVASSFSKNFGLYGHRAGALHVVSRNGMYIPAVASQLRVVARALYSTCPAHGARIVAAVLSNPERKALWKQECFAMATRLSETRAALLEELIEQNVKGDWSHLATQKGMFSFSGITAPTVKRLKDEYHIYLLGNGRVSLAGLNTTNVSIFVTALRNIVGENDNFYNVLGIAGTASVEEED
jgi:aspartate aminotransferase